tara:strand:- start:618 stop:1496 length:879 start_codon:yes stop_codon:yes gene_type:complete
MAFFGDLGKALGLGSTSDVAKFAVNAGASYASGGVIPIQTSPFERSEPQMIYTTEGNQYPQNMGSNSGIGMQSSGGGFFSNLGQGIGNFGTGLGQFARDISPLTSLFGMGGQSGRANEGTATTIINQRPDESSSSGEFLGANLGMGANLLTQGARFLRSPQGQGLIGGGLGLGAMALSGSDSGKVRITRRMKADVRRIYMMTGMNPHATGQILDSLGTYPRIKFSTDMVFFILTKRFRNDGPVVTKAAVRKTRSTLRRMKGVVDMYNSVCKPTTRRAPMRRATKSAVQLIKN